MSSNKSLKELTVIVKESLARYDAQGTKHWTWETAAKDLPYQVGSLWKVLLQKSNERYTDKTDKELDWQLRNELADILAEVLYIADELDIDLQQAIEEMVADDTDKIRKRV